MHIWKNTKNQEKTRRCLGGAANGWLPIDDATNEKKKNHTVNNKRKIDRLNVIRSQPVVRSGFHIA